MDQGSKVIFHNFATKTFYHDFKKYFLSKNRIRDNYIDFILQNLQNHNATD